MKDIEWSNGIGKRGRRAALMIRNELGELYEFTGESIPDIAHVMNSKYTKNGKWSHTTYQIKLNGGCESFPLREGWSSGEFFCEFNTLAEFAEHYKVTVENAAGFLYGNFSSVYERLKANECPFENPKEEPKAKEVCRILNLTQHKPTVEQVNEGVVGFEAFPEYHSSFDDPNYLQNSIRKYLTIDKLPTHRDLWDRSWHILKCIEPLKWKENELPTVMIGGADYMMIVLERMLVKNGYNVLHSFTERHSVDREVDGKIVKQNVFTFGGFINLNE